MSSTIPDLWPKFGEESPIPPVAILRQQGVLLGQRTANQVYGEVQSRAFPEYDGAFQHILWVVAPFLGYRRAIVCVVHKASLYPADIGAAKETAVPSHIVPNEPRKANSPEEFMQALQELLASEANVKLLNALIAQSAEPLPA